MTSRHRGSFVVGWVLAVAVLIWTLPGPASANGRVGQFVRQVAGPYEIALGTVPDSPVVGALHLTMTIRDTAAGSFVLDAGVTVSGVGPDGGPVEIGPVAARNSPSAPDFYEVNTSVDRVGTWIFTVSVSGAPGDASADFAIKVRSSNLGYRVFTWVTVLMFVAVVGLGLFPYLRRRMRRGR